MRSYRVAFDVRADSTSNAPVERPRNVMVRLSSLFADPVSHASSEHSHQQRLQDTAQSAWCSCSVSQNDLGTRSRRNINLASRVHTVCVHRHMHIHAHKLLQVQILLHYTLLYSTAVLYSTDTVLTKHGDFLVVQHFIAVYSVVYKMNLIKLHLSMKISTFVLLQLCFAYCIRHML